MMLDRPINEKGLTTSDKIRERMQILTADCVWPTLLADTGLLPVPSRRALTILAPAVATRALFLAIGEASAPRLLRPVKGTLSLLADI